MQKPKPKIMRAPITPSKITDTYACLHYYFLDRFGDRSKTKEISAGADLRIQQGLVFEKEVVAKIEGALPVPWEYPDFKTGYVKTLEILKKGSEWIYNGVLQSRNLLGNPDLLKRIDRVSKLGNYSYEPVDIKGHKKVQKADILQLYCYAYLLEPLLGYRPERGGIWLNTGKVEEIIFDGKIEAEFLRVLDQMRQIEEKKLKTLPVYCSACDDCPWILQCAATWLETDHVCLLSGVGAGLVKKLASIGITTCNQLSEVDPEMLVKTFKQKFESMDRLVLAAKARRDKKPFALKEPAFPEGMPIYYYDIETYGSATVVHGVIRLDKGKREERSFFADSPEDEEKIWRAFLNYISRDKKAIIYCWTMFEQGHIEALWEQYGGNEAGYKLLEKNLTDQKEFVKDHFVLPCRGYSIKQVAPVFGFHWQAVDAGGGNCEAWYGQWLENKDPDLCHKIVEYNLDDVRAMEVIDAALRKAVKTK